MKSFLSEGVYDPGIFKAIFLAGGPGSGKSTAVRKMVFPERYGLKNVNVDTLFEMFLKKADTSMDMTGGSSEERSERMRAFNRARGLTKKQQMNFIDGRLGMVIDGTGGSFGVINKQKKQLEDLGYDTFMIFVDTTLDTAVDRNIKRGEKGGRRLRDKDLVRSWNAVNKNKEAYIDLFGDNIVIVDGNKFDQKEIAKQSNVVRRFIEAQPADSEAKSWIANELRKKDSTVSESQIRKYVRSLLMEVPLDDFEYLTQDDDDVMVREEVANYFKAIPQSVNIYVAHTDDLSWAHRLPNEIQGKVSGFKSRGQVTVTDISNIGKMYPQIQKAMNPEGINLLYVYPKSFEVPAGGESFIADVNPHYLAHDLHHMLEGVPGGIGNKGKEQFSALIKEYLMELVWLSHGGGTMEAEHVRDSMKKTGRRLGVSNPDVLLSELFPGVNLPSGEFDLFGDIFADYLKNDGNLVLGVPEQLNMKNGETIELNPGPQHDNRAQQYEEKFKNMFDTVLDPLKGKVAMFNIFEVEHREVERARKQAEEKMQADHGPLIDLIKAMGGEFRYFDESYREEGVEELTFDTGLKPEKPVMEVDEFVQQFPKEVAEIESLGYKITSAFDGFGSAPVEIRLKRAVMKENLLREYVSELIKEETSAMNVALDLVGLIPGLGEFADAANAIDYARKGDYLFAGLSIISLVPAVGDAVGKGGKLAAWFTKAFPKGAKMVGKHGPKVVKQIKQAKKAIEANKDLIDDVFDEIEENEKFEGIKEHLPKIKEAINAFVGSAESGEDNVSEAKLRSYVRSLMLEESSEVIDDDEAVRILAQVAANLDAGVDSLDVERAGNRQVNESFLVTAYGTIISASGLAKLIGYTAKGIAIGLKKLGVKGVDPEKEGQTFFRLGDKIHHLYLGALKKLAAKMGVPPEKRTLAANVMFGVLLGAAMTATGIELASAIKGSKLGLAIGEGGMAGIKIGEGAETGANIFTLVREAFEAVPELAGTVVDVAETAEEVEQAIEIGGLIG
jgi:cytidylate kinase